MGSKLHTSLQTADSHGSARCCAKSSVPVTRILCQKISKTEVNIVKFCSWKQQRESAGCHFFLQISIFWVFWSSLCFAHQRA